MENNSSLIYGQDKDYTWGVAKREMTVKEMARLGGKARAAALSAEEITEISRKAGQLGGPARAKKLTAKHRKEIAQKAAAARWGKKR